MNNKLGACALSEVVTLFRECPLILNSQTKGWTLKNSCSLDTNMAGQSKRIYLFNCDNTYDLKIVEDVFAQSGRRNMAFKIVRRISFIFVCNKWRRSEPENSTYIADGFRYLCCSCKWISPLDQRRKCWDWLRGILQSYAAENAWVLINRYLVYFFTGAHYGLLPFTNKKREILKSEKPQSWLT